MPIGMFYEDDVLAVESVVNQCFPERGIMVEVGCFQGKSTLAWAQACEKYNKDIKIHSIDKFEGLTPRSPTPQEIEYAKQAGYNTEYLASEERLQHMQMFACTGDEQYQAFKNNLKDYSNVTVQKAVFNSKFEWNFMVDCVFYDADHTYEACKEALEFWSSRLAPGGVMCVHDYTDNWPGTIKAVNEVFPRSQKTTMSKQGFVLIK